MSELSEENGIELLPKNKFEEYEEIRRSGLINMLDYDAASEVVLLTKDEWVHILTNYLAYSEAYGEKERVDYDD